MLIFIHLKRRSKSREWELADAIENIDIGGPSMVRSAAKNYHDVTIVVDQADYDEVLAQIKRRW